MKHKFLIFAIALMASVMAGSMSAAPQLTYNGEVLEWNTEFDRTLVDYLNPEAVIPEVSGIACSRVTPGYLWMQSDEIQDYLIATDETGQTRYAKVQFPGENYLWDWEDLCGGVYEGKNYLFIGAFGDNDEERSDYCIVWFEEPEITGEQINITPSRINFQYPEGKRHNAEAIMYDNVEQMLYVITKVYYDVCQVFKLPFRTDYGSEKQTLEYVCDLGAKADLGEGDLPDKGFHLVTAADITPDGKYILIKNQNNTNAQYSWILLWERGEGESVADVVKRQPQPLKCYEVEWQGEAICWKDNDTFFTTSDSGEGERPPLYKYTRKAQEEPVEAIKRDIVIDGDLDEWADLTGLACASFDGAGEYDGLKELRCYADEKNIFFYLEYSAEAGEVEHLDIMLNTDGDETTGHNSWMWTNSASDYLIEAAPGENFADATFYIFNNEVAQEEWGGWEYAENEGLATACSPVTLTNGNKAIEGKIDVAKLPTEMVALSVAVFTSNSGWAESGVLPQIWGPALEVAIYREPTGVEAVESQKSKVESTKIIRDGQVLVIRDGKIFNLLGAEVR
jgi:hypothetical protein